MQKKLITSALPYVNNVPHLGNLIGSVLSADVYARFCRLQGYPTLYICATDEYGTATEIKALESNSTPEEVCEKFRKIHQAVYKFFNIQFDYFGKTPTQNHTDVTQSFFLELYKKGYIFQQTDRQYYCKKDKIFLADRFIEGACPYCDFSAAKGDQCEQCGKLLNPTELKNTKCKICKTTPVLKETNHLYLDLEKLKKPLVKFFEENSQKGNWTKNALQTTKKLLEKKLEPKPITRDLKWGVSVPLKGFEKKVFYVWFDAVLGYISATKEYLPKEWKNWWFNDDTKLYQFMAKDNIFFHTILLPAMKLGYTSKNWTKLFHINSSEYLNYENSKFSKSQKIGVFGDDLIKIGLPADLWRFYLLYNRPETADSIFEWKKFHKEINTHLVGNLGNLVNRITVFLYKNFQGKINIEELDEKEFYPIYKKWINSFLKEEKKITKILENVQLKKGLQTIFLLSDKGNKLFQLEEPWKKIKKNKRQVTYLLFILFSLVKDLSILLLPFTPQLAKKILDILNIKEQLSWEQIGKWDSLRTHQINKPNILLEKATLDKVEKISFSR